MNILTLNCWSHSIRYCLFAWDRRQVLADGTLERVAIGDSFISHCVPGRDRFCEEEECGDHRSAVAVILATLTDPGRGVLADMGQIAAVGHRVVHGGEKFCRSAMVDDRALDELRELRQLAPLHNAPNIAGIEAARELLPDIPHVAIFDTAFHQTMPEHAYIYPLPYEWYEKYGIRRYGFHGPSHLYLAKRAAVLLGKPADECNLVTIHIDRGVSLCAIRNGVSVDTSMGLTPLEGAIMGTRCGDIDPGILTFMMQEKHLSARDMEHVLNQKSGLCGITGRHMDRRHMLEGVLDGDERCRLALEMEAYRLRKYIGAFLAVAGPLDGVVFTEGVGTTEWLARERTLAELECFGIRLDRERNRNVSLEGGESLITADNSALRAFVIPSDEELVFAEDVAAIVAGKHGDHLSCGYSFGRPDFIP
jgi:acetate kinase